MKWWHAWRSRVWEQRYLYAQGKLTMMKEQHGNAAVDTLEFADTLAERETAVSAVHYHRAKAGITV